MISANRAAAPATNSFIRPSRWHARVVLRNPTPLVWRIARRSPSRASVPHQTAASVSPQSSLLPGIQFSHDGSTRNRQFTSRGFTGGKPPQHRALEHPVGHIEALRFPLEIVLHDVAVGTVTRARGIRTSESSRSGLLLLSAEDRSDTQDYCRNPLSLLHPFPIADGSFWRPTSKRLEWACSSPATSGGPWPSRARRRGGRHGHKRYSVFCS